jgi:hypothetical protein
MKNTKKEKVKLSEELHSLVNAIRDVKWDEVELQLHSPQIKCLSERELFLAFYTTVLVACHEIPATNPLIPPHILSVFETFFSFGVDINSVSPQGHTPLTSVAKALQPDLMRYFIEKQADVNQTSCFGTPIDIVGARLADIVHDGDFTIETIKTSQQLAIQTATILLENGADPNKESHDGAHCIISAIQSCCEEFVQLLLDHGIDFTRGVQTERYSMEITIQFSTPEILKLLLEYGLSPTVSLERKMSPLSFAQKHGKPEMADILNQALKPNGIVRKYPTKKIVQKTTPQSEPVKIPLDESLIGQYCLDMEATIEYQIELQKKILGDKLPEGFIKEAQQLWNKNAEGLKEIELHFDGLSLTLKNSEDEETYPLSVRSNTQGKTIIFIDGFCSNEIEIKKIKTDRYQFEAEDCELADAVWKKIK